jgi:hypothetical protein
MIIKLCKQRKSEIKLMLVIAVVVFILGTILLAIVMKTDNEPTTFEIGTALVSMLLAFYVLIIGALSYGQEFNMAIQMGVTRKQFTPAYFITSLIFVSVNVLVIYGFHFIENFEIATFYASYEKDTGIEQFLLSWNIIPLILLLAALPQFIGCLTMKFGKKAFWVIWALWMIGCMLPSRIINAMKKGNDSILAKLGNGIAYVASHITPVGGFVSIIVLTVIIIILTYLLSRKQAVTIA